MWETRAHIFLSAGLCLIPLDKDEPLLLLSAALSFYMVHGYAIIHNLQQTVGYYHYISLQTWRDSSCSHVCWESLVSERRAALLHQVHQFSYCFINSNHSVFRPGNKPRLQVPSTLHFPLRSRVRCHLSVPPWQLGQDDRMEGCCETKKCRRNVLRFSVSRQR